MSLYASGIIRIISDIELKHLQSGTTVANFAGGINEGKDKSGNYIKNAMDVEVWGKSAELIAENLRKGDAIFVSGSVRMQEWADRETGKNRRKHVLNVQRFEFLPRTATEQEEPF